MKPIDFLFNSPRSEIKKSIKNSPSEFKVDLLDLIRLSNLGGLKFEGSILESIAFWRG